MKEDCKWLRWLIAALLMAAGALSSCQVEKEVREDGDKAVSRPSFLFAYSQTEDATAELHELRGEWEESSINSEPRDEVRTIRIVCPAKQLNVKMDLSTLSAAKKRSPRYLLESIPEGEEQVFYFIANEPEAKSEEYAAATFDPEDAMIGTERFFRRGANLQSMTMVSQYKVKREGGKYFYQRVYPEPHNGYMEVSTLQDANQQEVLGVPVLLFPIYSRFTVTIELAKDYHFDPQKEGQTIEMRFEGYPAKTELFSNTSSQEKLKTKTYPISLQALIEGSAPASYQFYFPATDTPDEMVTLHYTFEGVEKAIEIEPKQRERFDLNTHYKLPIDVFVNRSYDIWIEDIFSVKLNEIVKVTNGNGGDFQIKNSKKKGLIHVGVAHNYRTMLKIKSRLEPAEVVIPEDSGIHWILAEPEVKELREIEFDEEGFPNYIQYFPLKYRVDYTGQKDPLIAHFKYVNTGDRDKKVDFTAAFNIISRFAKINLGGVNKFVNGQETEDNITKEDLKKYGPIFQFGRNAPIEPKRGIPKYYVEPVSLDDPIIWNSKTNNGYYKTIGNPIANTPEFIVTDPADLSRLEELSGKEETIPDFKIFTWFKWGEKGYFINIPEEINSWSKMILKQKELAEKAGYKVPEWYVGNNNGDPCPRGYKMPTMQDVSAIFYNKEVLGYHKNSDGHYRNSKLKKVHVTEANKSGRYGNLFDETLLNPSGNPAVADSISKIIFKTIYYRKSVNLVYARRFIGTQFESLFRYENRPDGVIITCLPLEKRYMNEPESVMTNEEFWNREDNQWLQEEIFFPDNYGSFVNIIKVIKYDNPDVWTSTALPGMGGMDIDFTFVMDQNDIISIKYSGSARTALPIRCMRI